MPLTICTSNETTAEKRNFDMDFFNNSTSALNATGFSHLGNSMPHFRVLVLIIYLATFLVGVFGNTVVIYMLLTYREARRKSVANYYILNLAFADDLFMMAVPLFCIHAFTDDWPFGNPFCKISYIIRESNKFASVFTLTALSLDRFLASFHSMSAVRTIRAGKIVCAAIWVSSILICWPYWLYARSSPAPQGHYSCGIKWPTPSDLTLRWFWVYFQLTFGLLLPLFIIVLSYGCLMRRLKQIMKPRGNSRIRDPNRRLTQTVLAVVIIFLCCQTPSYVLDIVHLNKVRQILELKANNQNYLPSRNEQILYSHLNAFTEILVYISSCCNPLVYGIFNENFRKLYRVVLCQRTRHRSSRSKESRQHSSRRASVHKSTKSQGKEDSGKGRNGNVKVVIQLAESSHERSPLNEEDNGGMMIVPGLRPSDSGFSISSLQTYSFSKSLSTQVEHTVGCSSIEQD